MANPRREHDDEPLTQLDVNIDTGHLDPLVERDVSTSPGGPPTTQQGTIPDDEPLTMEPPRVLGAHRLRAHTMLGVAPPSSGANGPPTTEKEKGSIPKILFDADDNQDVTETKPADIPKIAVEGDDEQTTMVGKLLAEAHAQVAKRLKEKEPDLYSDETATTVGDAEKLIATANAAVVDKDDKYDNDEPTESRSAHDALMEDTTSRREAIDVEAALAKAAELRAEAERKKKQAKKRTMHGLGDGPLRLPAKPKLEEEIPTSEHQLPETGERAAVTRSSNKLVVAPPVPLETAPADGEMETLSAGVPQPAPMRSIGTEPETMPVQVPSSRDRLPTTPADPSSMLGPPTPERHPFAGNLQQTLSSPQGAPSYTQPMPYAPTVRMDDQRSNIDPALKATMSSPIGPPSPQGGVPLYHSGANPVLAPQYSMQPHSGPQAFAQTALQSGGHPAIAESDKKKGGVSPLVFLIFILAALTGIGIWQRAWLAAAWAQYRSPAPIAPTAEPAPSVTASTTTAAPTTPPPVATDTAPHGSSSAAPRGSSSATPHGSSSAGPHPPASASASAKPSTKKPAPWKPPSRPKPTGVTPKPKPVDDSRGF